MRSMLGDKLVCWQTGARTVQRRALGDQDTKTPQQDHRMRASVDTVGARSVKVSCAECFTVRSSSRMLRANATTSISLRGSSVTTAQLAWTTSSCSRVRSSFPDHTRTLALHRVPAGMTQAGVERVPGCHDP